MTWVADDACPHDWAEFNLPAELLKQLGDAAIYVEIMEVQAAAATSVSDEQVVAEEMQPGEP